ncbi:MAG: class I tRNA ligase family protein, partial [Kiritimatiellae bacterium]|nr:class I tRNA ligase family protein [Kiritimatiellia bacterium]
MLKPVSNKVNFPAMEEEILRFWEDHQTFQKSVDQRRGGREYVFYDGPPFATGLPHYGHLLASTIKDIIPRYQAMRGHLVERRFGWDCHGLPIEALAQEALGLAGTAAIKEAGVDVFNEQCRSMVLTYVSEWRKTITRLGRWVDFDHDYKTMDVSFMESVWWVFKQLWDQGRIYKDYRIMPYSWKLTTPLSNFEANSNYKYVQDPDITVRFRLKEAADLPSPLYALVWTTTPWTL